MDGVDEGPRRQGPLQGRGPPARADRQGRHGKQKAVTDGPFAEAKDLVGGYTLVEAKDLAHAAELVDGLPHPSNAGGLSKSARS